MVHQPNRPASDGAPDESPFLPLRRRNSVLETNNEYIDVRQPTPSPPPSRPVFHPPPRPAATRESVKIKFGFYDSDDDYDISRDVPEYGSGSLRPQPMRRNSLELEPFNEGGYNIEPASRGRQRPSKYYSPRRSNEKVRDGLPQDYEFGGMTQPLTAESLRLSKHIGTRSTRNSVSGGESDRAQFGGGSVGSSNGENDITIKVPAGAVAEAGNAKIYSKDGGDINIGRNVGVHTNYVPDDADDVASAGGQAQSSSFKSLSPEGNKEGQFTRRLKPLSFPEYLRASSIEQEALKATEEVGVQPSASQTQDKPEGGSQVWKRDAPRVFGDSYVYGTDKDGNIVPDSLRHARET